jgi:carbon starvation protein
MNTLAAVVIGLVVSYLGYTQYARKIDRRVIQTDPNKMTPARMYTDGVDFVPTSRNVLFGYHFKSIAAAGPIVGAITAANLWGWFPALIWLAVGVTFLGWASDYSAIIMSVRNDGNSLSAIAHRLIAPRTRLILFLFIFFYLLLVGGAFGGILTDILNRNSQAPLGIIGLMLMGLLLGQMLYRWRVGLVPATVIAVGVTFVLILLGPSDAVKSFFNDTVNGGVNSLNGNQPVITYFDPTVATPNAPAGTLGVEQQIRPRFIFWGLVVLAFCYFGSVLPIWRWAQPVVYVGFWITAVAMVLGLAGAALAIVLKPEIAQFQLVAFKGWDGGLGGAFQPIWPMLFVTIACGAISGWHALFGSVGTARQLEYETDALPVGGGAMFMEFLLGLLALLAVSIVGTGGGAGRFANGLGNFISVVGVPLDYAVSLAFAAFIVIVLVVTQLVFRVMRVTLAEWLGESMPAFRSIHVSTIASLALALFLMLTGTWIYLWQLFGGANQLMASLSLLLVTLWLLSTGRNALYAGIPMVFMYVTTIAANVVTAYNLYATVLLPNIGQPGRELPVIGAAAMIVVALILDVAALVIGYDAWVASRRFRERPATQTAPVGA